MAASSSVVRVLHVIGVMDRGGAETWLMHVLRNIDRERFQLDFLVHNQRAGAYDREIKYLGSNVIPCPWTRSPGKYARCLAATLAENGPYNVVHSHVHYYSGFVLRIAAGAGVPRRVSHSHSDTSRARANASPGRRLYWWLMRRWLEQYESAGLAASELAAVALWGPEWKLSPHRRILRCGIDLAPFKKTYDRAAIQGELGLTPGVPVLGHVGRFDGPKNQAFLVSVLECAQRRNIPLQLLLIGDGESRPAIQKYVEAAGLASRVVFAGSRDDVPRLLMGAVDVFALPSHWEGLPVSALEAQAAGLPSLISTNVTREVDVVPGLAQFLPLESGPELWLDAVFAVLSQASRASHTQCQAIETLECSDFNIAASVAELTRLYRSES